MSREAFGEAATFFTGLVRQVREEQWSAPALGVWTVRELARHGANAFVSIAAWDSTARTADSVEMAGAVDFYVRVLAPGGPGETIAERQRKAAQELTGDLRQKVTADSARALALLDDIPDDHPTRSLAGGMRFVDWLDTRTLELTVHGLDLAKAIGVAADPPQMALRKTLAVLAELAIMRGVAGELALALTGRGPLPDGFSLMAQGS